MSKEEKQSYLIDNVAADKHPQFADFML